MIDHDREPPAMPPPVTGPHDGAAVLAALELRIGRLRFTAEVQDLLGKAAEAGESRVEADRLEFLLGLLRTPTVGLAAAPRESTH